MTEYWSVGILLHYSLAQTLAQTGFFSPAHSPGSVAPGRAGQANWGEAPEFPLSI